MDSPLPLVTAGLRERLRSRAAAVLGVAALGALAAAALVSAGGGGDPAPVATDATLLVLGAIAALVAAGAGSDLPARRTSGADEWLATTAPSPLSRRLAVAGTGAAATLAVAVGTTALAALFLALAGRTVPTRSADPLPLPSPAPRLVARAVPGGGNALDLALPPDRGGVRALEVDLRPVWRDLEASGTERPGLLVSVDGGPVTRADDVPARGSWRLSLAGGARHVRLEAADAKADVVVLAARVLGPSTPFAANLLWAGLLLALAAASVVPAAVLLSRGVSGPTAAAAAALLFLVGVYHEPLLSLASDVESRGRWPAAVLQATAFLSPDLSGLSAVSEASRGREIPLALSIGSLWPAFAHAGVCLAALSVGRRRGA